MTTRVWAVFGWLLFFAFAALVLWYVAFSAARLFSFAAIVAVLAYVSWSIAERAAEVLRDAESESILPRIRYRTDD